MLEENQHKGGNTYFSLCFRGLTPSSLDSVVWELVVRQNIMAAGMRGTEELLS
jgi:hypothetical protein